MDPRIQYAKTSDGVSIAYATQGEGVPYVIVSMTPWCHLQAEAELPERRAMFERLASTRMLVRYDTRGFGLSGRSVSDFSLAAHLTDLTAVVAAIKNQEKIVLFGTTSTSPVAIAYSADHPDRVSHLILWGGFASAPESYGGSHSQIQAMRTLRETDWDVYTETVAQFLTGWTAGAAAHRYALYYRTCAEPEQARAALEAMNSFDVRDRLSEVRAQTLVIYRSGAVWPSLDDSRRLASGIRGARLIVQDGALIPTIDELDRIQSQFEEFLGGEGAGRSTSAASEDSPSVGTSVILFTDIADSTALTEKLGDTAFRGKARRLDAALRSVIQGHSGTPIEGKLLGDGVMAVFTSARQAIEAALACAEAGNDGDLPLHAGLHAGDVIREEDGNVYGGAVNIAARIAAGSAPGEVLVSQTVRDLARTSAGVAFEGRGERSLKGVSEPVRVYGVSRREAG